MNRIREYAYSEIIQAGFNLLPAALRQRLESTHFFCGVDPVWAGLFSDENTDDGRSYRSMWCACYPEYIYTESGRWPTIVMPEIYPDYPSLLNPLSVVHELGHILDWQLGLRHNALPITKYAEKNRAEAFAEAFTHWIAPDRQEWYPILREIDEKTLEVFQEL